MLKVSLFLVIQLKSYEIETVHYRGYLFFETVKMLKFHTDSPQVVMFLIYKFHKNLFLEWPKIFEYLVVKRKNCNNFDYSL